jgi:DNA-binding NarL/FixJ family response regulator
LDLLANGYTTQGIAAELCITTSTVRNHLVAIYQVFGTNNRVQVTLLYRGLAVTVPQCDVCT